MGRGARRALTSPAAALPLGRLDFFKVLVLGLVLIASQGTVSVRLGWGRWAPEAAVILTVYVVWRAEKWTAILAAFILGLFRDAAGGGPLGVYQTTLVLAAWFFYPWRRWVHLEAPLPLMISVFGLTLGGATVGLTPLMAALGWPGSGFSLFPAFLASALASALAAPPLFGLLKWILGRPAG